MQRADRFLRILLAGAVVAGVTACADGNLDDPELADSQLEVTLATFPPVTAALDQTQTTCVFTVTNASVTMTNKPKSSLAISSPANDIVVDRAIITYTWDDNVTSGPVTFELGNTIGANGAGQLQYPPIGAANLDASRAGHIASMSIRYVAHSISGKDASIDGGGTLFVNSCQ